MNFLKLILKGYFLLAITLSCTQEKVIVHKEFPNSRFNYNIAPTLLVQNFENLYPNNSNFYFVVEHKGKKEQGWKDILDFLQKQTKVNLSEAIDKDVLLNKDQQKEYHKLLDLLSSIPNLELLQKYYTFYSHYIDEAFDNEYKKRFYFQDMLKNNKNNIYIKKDNMLLENSTEYTKNLPKYCTGLISKDEKNIPFFRITDTFMLKKDKQNNSYYIHPNFDNHYHLMDTDSLIGLSLRFGYMNSNSSIYFAPVIINNFGDIMPNTYIIGFSLAKNNLEKKTQESLYNCILNIADSWENIVQ